MIARALISNDVPPLKTSDTGEQAVRWMSEFQVRHLPIVNHKSFLGLISEDDILDANQPSEAIGSYKLNYFKPFVKETDHLFDVLRTFHELKITLLPVVSLEEDYLGVITLDELLHNFADFTSISGPGGIIVLDVHANDLSISEIGRIVESEGGTILALFTTTHRDSTKLELTLKVNKTDVRDIIQSFERYEYEIIGFFHQQKLEEDLKERYDLLMRYLNI